MVSKTTVRIDVSFFTPFPPVQQNDKRFVFVQRSKNIERLELLSYSLYAMLTIVEFLGESSFLIPVV